MPSFLNSELLAMADGSGPVCLEHGYPGNSARPHNGCWTDVKSDWKISNGGLSHRVQDAIESAFQAPGRRQAFGVAR